MVGGEVQEPKKDVKLIIGCPTHKHILWKVTLVALDFVISTMGSHLRVFKKVNILKSVFQKGVSGMYMKID